MTVSYAAPETLAFTGGALRFAPDRVTEPGPQLFDPANPALAARPVSVGGRQAAWYVGGPGAEAVLRHYRRGGLIARISLDRYLWTGAARTRSFAEFDILDFLYRKGLPVPRPLAAAYWRCGLRYRAAIVTELIPEARTLARSLDDCRPEAIAAAIHAVHEAGVWHADLNAFNILLDGAGKTWLIDFDRGRRCVVDAARRQANLQRLRRSLAKVAGPAGERCWEAINLAYTELP
jgi:3-deoxy-D-manno-octulosonic acid kinase